jgi:hypothetical protein
VAEQSAAEVQSLPSHRREMSSASPGYSPALSTPSTVGAAAACSMVVRGTSSSAALLVDVPDAEVVLIV